MPSPQPHFPRFRFEAAGREHDAALRRLMAETPMEGEIEVSFCREPDYFLGTAVQGGFQQVIAVRDTHTGDLVGVGARAVRNGFLNGKVVPVGYLADLRLRERFRGGPFLLGAFRHLARLHADGRTALYFTVIAEGNQTALRALTSGARGLPPYHDLGRLLSPAVNLLRRKPEITLPGVEIVPGNESLLPQIVECLNRHAARRQFAPTYEIAQFLPGVETNPLSPTLHQFQVEEFRVALRNGRVVGVLGKWDQGGFKQTVVTRYGGKIRLVRPLVNALAGPLGLPRFPPVGEQIRFFYAAFPAVAEEGPEGIAILRALVRRLYNEQVGSGYAYFLLGFHQQDPLAAVLREYTLTPFAGRLFAVHFPDGERVFQSLDDRVPYVELAML